jgi:hypothetical protein
MSFRHQGFALLAITISTLGCGEKAVDDRTFRLTQVVNAIKKDSAVCQMAAIIDCYHPFSTSRTGLLMEYAWKELGYRPQDCRGAVPQDSVALDVTCYGYPISEIPAEVVLALESARCPVPDSSTLQPGGTCDITEGEAASLAEDTGSKHVLFLKEVSPNLVYAEYKCRSVGKSFFPFQYSYYCIINQSGFVEKVVPLKLWTH